MNQKGATLPTVIVFLALTLLLVLRGASIYKGQMQQFILLNNYYQGKILSGMATSELEKYSAIRKQPVPQLTITYTIGQVHLVHETDKIYKIKVRLANDYQIEESYVALENALDTE